MVNMLSLLKLISFSYIVDFFNKPLKTHSKTNFDYALTPITITEKHFEQAAHEYSFGIRKQDPVSIALKEHFPNDTIKISVDNNDYCIFFNDKKIDIPNNVKHFVHNYYDNYTNYLFVSNQPYIFDLKMDFPTNTIQKETIFITPEHFKKAKALQDAGKRYIDPVTLALRENFPNDTIKIDIDSVFGDSYHIVFNGTNISLPNHVQNIIHMFDHDLNNFYIPKRKIKFDIKISR